jgi:hypothetical protein
MNPHRPIALATTTLLACALIASSASASPLLSGYGGPGAGSQVLLGSQLIGGGGSSGGGGSEGGAGSTSLAAPQSGAATGSHSSSGSAGGVHRHAHRGAVVVVRTGKPGTATDGRGGVELAYTPAGSSNSPGLTGTDWLLIALALVALAAVGVLTARLVRSGRAHAAAKDLPGAPRRGS